ncbi:uncharacterized protein HaLaN_17156, partial [Haematococcus lacustris]
QLGRIHVAAFSDEVLHLEMCSKGHFWCQNQFFGVDLSPLYSQAVDSYFSQVVVDAFSPQVLVSTCATKVLDFGTVTEAMLQDILIPLELQVPAKVCAEVPNTSARAWGAAHWQHEACGPPPAELPRACRALWPTSDPWRRAASGQGHIRLERAILQAADDGMAATACSV